MKNLENNTDQNFPLIFYPKNQSYGSWGELHGEEFRTGIKELAQIRKELMLQKNPALKNNIEQLAKEQFLHTETFAPHLTQELIGIARGADLSISDLVILNNYTDFRDIELSDEGCSTVHIQNKNNIVAGQTWDMHSSAKNYLAMIKVPATETTPELLIMTLVGCLGLMGVNSKGCFLGVNNINTKNAKTGLIWSALVRSTLEQSNILDMEKRLTSAPVTSGHNYILSTSDGENKHWEITPEEKQCIADIKKNQTASSFHTNHCLGDKIIMLEDKNSISSTTHKRYELLEKLIPETNNYDDLRNLLTNHQGHPLSICSHYESGAQDPSMTCGGGIADLKNFKYEFWRGCPKHDDNFKKLNFELKDDLFIKL
jgi:isopenicillin-N N-acyltransferase-like protein